MHPRAPLVLRLVMGVFLVHHAAWILLADAARWGDVLTALGGGPALLPVLATVEAAAGLALLGGAPVRAIAFGLSPWYATWAVTAHLGMAGPTGWLVPAAVLGVLLTLGVLGGGRAAPGFRVLAEWDARVLGRRVAPASPFGMWPLRVSAAVVMAYQGMDKVQRPGEWVDIFASLGIPAPEVLAPLVAFAEVAGALGLLLGVLVRFTSVVFIGILTTAIATAWLPLPPGTGWHLDVLLIGGFVVLAWVGPGRPTLESILGPGFRDPEVRVGDWWRRRGASHESH